MMISNPTTHLKEVFIFVDGNNLIERFEAVASKRKIKPTDQILTERSINWKPKSFVWRQGTLRFPTLGGSDRFEIVRAYYYVPCDPSHENELLRLISGTRISTQSSDLTLTPVIIPKVNSDRKTKGDDIKLCIDAIEHAMNLDSKIFYIFTNDGDFVPLVEKLQHMGKYVFIAGFLDGLNEKLKIQADFFLELEPFFWGQST